MQTGLAFELATEVALAPFTTWQVGGPARFFHEVESAERLQAALAWARAEGLPVVALGRGSNTLIADAGFDGLVLHFGAKVAGVRFEGRTMIAGAGAPLAAMVVAAQKHGLGGLEPMVGVPGTVGGAVAMNASAHGVAISEGFEGATVVDADGRHAWRFEDFAFAYRESRLQHPGAPFFFEGRWTLCEVEAAAGRARIQELQRWRHAKQPTNVPTGGSTFRNPEAPGAPSAGALIEAAGLKGKRVGGAFVSEKHANFLVNDGTAKAADIQALIREIQAAVEAETGYVLLPEVKGLGLSLGRAR